MNRNSLYTGIGFSITGIILLIWTFYLKSMDPGLLTGFGISFLLSGIVTIIRYLYWTRPENRSTYEEKLKAERIDSHDEFKNKIRGLTIRYTYIAELCFVSFSIIGLGIVNQFYEIENLKFIMIYLGSLILFQLLFSTLMYRHILNKYLK